MNTHLDLILEQITRVESERSFVYDIIENKTYTHAEFARIVNQLANYLDGMNDEIVICEDNGIALMILYFAGILSKKVLIPIDPEKEADEIKRIRNLHIGASFLDKGVLPRIIQELNMGSGNTRLLWADADFEKEFLITYTSGSTGIPKGVRHTAKNLFVSAYEFGSMMQYSKNMIMGHCMPMTYMAGILNTIIMPYVMGGCIAILPRFSMQSAFSFWKHIKESSVNTLWLSPTMLRIVNMVDKRAEMREYLRMNHMKISVGTAPLDKTLRDTFEKKYHIRLYQSYGLSETLFISTEVPEERISKHTVGHLLPSVRILYSDEGELQIDVPWMFLGYTNEDTAAYMQQGRYLSGDLGRIDSDGNLIITGRKKEMIVRGGYNVNPRDIENILIEKGYVLECAVVSVLIRGEEMIACCYTANQALNLIDINKDIINILGKHNKIDFLERVKTLPKNLNGKVDKHMIRKMIGEQYDSKI